MKHDGICRRRGPELREILQENKRKIEEALEKPVGAASVELRPILDATCMQFWAAVRLWQLARYDAVSEEDDASLEHFLESHIREERTRDEDYYERIRLVSSGY